MPCRSLPNERGEVIGHLWMHGQLRRSQRRNVTHVNGTERGAVEDGQIEAVAGIACTEAGTRCVLKRETARGAGVDVPLKVHERCVGRLQIGETYHADGPDRGRGCGAEDRPRARAATSGASAHANSASSDSIIVVDRGGCADASPRRTAPLLTALWRKECLERRKPYPLLDHKVGYRSGAA